MNRRHIGFRVLRTSFVVEPELPHTAPPLSSDGHDVYIATCRARGLAVSYRIRHGVRWGAQKGVRNR